MDINITVKIGNVQVTFCTDQDIRSLRKMAEIAKDKLDPIVRGTTCNYDASHAYQVCLWILDRVPEV